MFDVIDCVIEVLVVVFDVEVHEQCACANIHFMTFNLFYEVRNIHF